MADSRVGTAEDEKILLELVLGFRTAVQGVSSIRDQALFRVDARSEIRFHEEVEVNRRNQGPLVFLALLGYS